MTDPGASGPLASDDAPSASMAGLLGPGADAESLVLGLLNRQDLYPARRTCHARRRELGARTTTLVLSQDEAGEDVLPSVDLASSFPALRTLVLLCMGSAEPGWPERCAAFVSRNAAALQQLRHLDMSYDMLDAGVPTSITSTVLAALARLPSLQSLHVTVDRELSPSCWGALGSLKQLTGLRVQLTTTVQKEQLQHIVGVAPQLQELWLVTKDFTNPEQLACLCSLELRVAAAAAPAVLSLTALQGLTHLALSGRESNELVAAVAQLTGLASLKLRDGTGGVALEPLAALQQLTSLIIKRIIGEQQARVLADLGQLRRLEADFASSAAAAAARLGRLEECKVGLLKVEQHGRRVVVQAPGHLCTNSLSLSSFDLSSVHTLRLNNFWHRGPCECRSSCHAVPSCVLCAWKVIQVGWLCAG
jgi:hypothetical protein